MVFAARLFLVIGFLVAPMLGSANTAQAQIVAIGASNVAGRGVSSSDAWPAQREGMLAAKGRNVHVTNAGISGDTNAGMLARLDSAVPQGTKVVLLDRYGGGWNARRLGIADHLCGIGRVQTPRRFIFGIRIIPMWWNAALRQYLQPDGIHFTVEGHRLEATRMLPSVMGAVH